MRKIKTLIAAAALALTAPLLAACSNSVDASEPSANLASSEAVLTLSDGWAKAADAAGMTGVFGTLSNSSDEDILITGVESDSAEFVELHEVTEEGVMQEIDGDVIVPAKGTYVLAPGANHVMLMNLHEGLLAGDEVTFTLHYSVGDESDSSTEFTVFVKDYAGANEDYASDHGGHDEHGEHDEGHEGHAAEEHTDGSH